MQTEELQKVLINHSLYQESEGERGAIADLSNADLSGDDLNDSNLYCANLSRVNLSRVNLSGANLRGANLRGANFYNANLKDADLRGADLSGASLGYADLSGAKIDLNIEDGLLRKVALMILGDRESFDNALWHSSCNTVHCIAGYACFMAKDKEIEGRHGTEVAGLLLLGIEAHSHFYDSDKAAIKWLEEVVERPVTA